MWAVTLTYPIDATMEQMDAWEAKLEDLDASIARVPSVPYGPIDSVDVTVYLDSDNAISDARLRVDPIVESSPVAAEMVDEELHIARAGAPTLPAMVSAPEVADMLGVTRQRVHQLRSHHAFPTPLIELRTGPIWSQAAVDKFARGWTRKPGRPVKQNAGTGRWVVDKTPVGRGELARMAKSPARPSADLQDAIDRAAARRR